MTAQLKFDLFPVDRTEMDEIRDEIFATKEANNRVRRSVYAKLDEVTRKNKDLIIKYGEMTQICVELKARLEIIERNICCERKT